MSWMNRLAGLLRPRKLDADLDDEVQFHIESREQQYLADGLTPAEARRQAHLAFSGRDRVKEECREARWRFLLESIVQDIRHGLRVLMKSPAFTAVAVLSLGLGIGASTAILSVIDLPAIR